MNQLVKSAELHGERKIKTFYRDSAYSIVSKMAYLTGVPESYFNNKKTTLKHEIYEELEENKNARIIRNLCAIRTALERYYFPIYKAITYNLKNLDTLPEYIPQESLLQLKEDGITVQKANTKPETYIININKLIGDRINNCKDVFPLWLNWNYIEEAFLMPEGGKTTGLKKAAKYYDENKDNLPYQVYVNWNPKHLDGNIFLDDKKFVTLLYKAHGAYFGDPSKITDAGAATKEGIYKFLEKSEKVCVMVDCENSDPFKFCATLKNLKKETLIEKIDKIILYDDIHTSSAWEILGDFTEVPTERITIDRVKWNKSLVDMKLATGTCKEYYENNTKAFIVVSSDSDYWGLITSLPDAKFLVMAEREKCGDDIRKALEEQGMTYCFIDDFCAGSGEDMKIAAVLSAVNAKIKNEVNLNLHGLFNESLSKTRANFSDEEKTKLYEKIAKKIQISVSTEGDISIAVTA